MESEIKDSRRDAEAQSIGNAAKDGRGDESPRTGQESEVAEDEMLG